MSPPTLSTPLNPLSRHVGKGAHPAHAGLQQPQEQQGPLDAQPGPEDFLCTVRLQEPPQHGVQAVLKEEAGLQRRLQCTECPTDPVWKDGTAEPSVAAAGGFQPLGA